MNHSSNPNTFGIERFAKTIVRAETEQQLLSARQTAAAAGEPTLILGKAVMSCSERLCRYGDPQPDYGDRGERNAGSSALARRRRRKLASTGAVHATACDAGLENLALILAAQDLRRSRILAPTALSYSGFANMLTALSWKPGVSNVFQPRNAVLAIATVSSNMNIRTAMPSLRLAYR